MTMVNDISLAQWSLIEEFRAGKWKTLDFPKIAREDFGLNGIELVNTLFELPTERYLRELKQRSKDVGVENVLIMIDDEGDGCEPSKKGRSEFEIFHRKWVDIAHYLGCHAIRTNCRGPENVNKREALEWAAESYHLLLDYAFGAGITILIENHGGVSNDADWMVELMKKVDRPNFGTYPDWRQPSAEFDNFTYLRKTLPFAKGMSYRNQPEDKLSIDMIRLCKSSAFNGWYGIESGGRNQIDKAIKLLKRELSRG